MNILVFNWKIDGKCIISKLYDDKYDLMDLEMISLD